MSLAWRILLFALLLNVLTVGSVQIVVHQAQQRWFEDQSQILRNSVQGSFEELERVYPAEAVDAASNAAVVRGLLRNSTIRELYDDVIVTRGQPPFEGVYLNALGAVHRDPDRFRLDEIAAGIALARQVDGGIVPVAGGYVRALRRRGRVVGHLWFVPKFRPELPSSMPLWTALLGVGASTLLFGVVLFWLTRRTVDRPMRDIEEAAQAVAGGHYDVRLPERQSVPELRTLLTTFNRMAEQVGNQTGNLQQAVDEAVAATEQKERALVQSSRLATIGTLAAGVAHEINNPLGGMQNAINRLVQADGLTDKQRVYLKLVQDGLQRVARTTRRMLEFAPKDAQPKPFVMRVAVDGAYALVEHRCPQENADVSFHLPEDLPQVHGDAHEIQQVILNLFLNSLDAMNGSGGKINARAHAEGNLVHVTIEDNGPGIDAEDLARVFDPFFSKKDRPDASGLGMFISYSIVQNHGGVMRCESTPGEGFRTILELPVAPE